MMEYFHEDLLETCDILLRLDDQNGSHLPGALTSLDTLLARVSRDGKGRPFHTRINIGESPRALQ